ncbi:hypothetical protein DY000_02009497 [Brassica cretica]|uniref:Uncharacterized protein n=1 Tax=Brassica cretica TaxID=69181 RepID=A0ABQ7BX15_BRACR|nr:hypothetical protein DY000_02009497 [Brassica cretica]
MKNHGGQEWDEAEGEHRRQRLMLISSNLRLLRKSCLGAFRRGTSICSASFLYK